jgi:hypothetical protein
MCGMEDGVQSAKGGTIRSGWLSNIEAWKRFAILRVNIAVAIA